MRIENEFERQVKATLDKNYFYEPDSPITSVKTVKEYAVRIYGYFNWAEQVTVTTHEELIEAMLQIRSASWNFKRHLYAKEYVRSRQITLMSVSDHLLRVDQLEELYRAGVREAMWRGVR